jgi:hypothetical protein
MRRSSRPKQESTAVKFEIQAKTQKRLESGARVCLERDVENGSRVPGRNARDSTHNRSFTSRDSFRKSTTITNTKPSWPLHPFTSQICDHFGTPRSTRPCHAFVFRPKTPRDRGLQGFRSIRHKDRATTSIWYVDCEHSHSLLAFLTFLSVSRLLSISTISLCARSRSSSHFLHLGSVARS